MALFQTRRVSLASYIKVVSSCFAVLRRLRSIRTSVTRPVFVSRRNLRSASTANLVVPRFQRKTLGGRAFPVAAAQAWNSLQSRVTSSSSLASFKRSLKTELFLRSYVEA